MKISSQNTTVLVIDDDEGNRVLLKSQLKLEKYDVLLAKDGPEGIHLAQINSPDIILLDIMMPRVDGFAVCRQLKNDPQTRSIPIIIITALNEVSYRIQGIRAGADEFLTRPYNREELSVRVRNLVKLRHTLVKLKEERNQLQLLYEIGQSINVHLDLDALMCQVIEQTLKAVGATKGNIILLDDAGRINRRFNIHAGSEPIVQTSIKAVRPTKGFISRLLQQKQSEIIDDVSTDPRWLLLERDSDQTVSALGVPLTRKDGIIGALILNHPKTNYFTTQHFSFVQTIATQISSALENAYLFKEVSEERHKLEALLTQSSDALIVIDENLSISIVNQAAEALFNIQADEIIGKQIHEISKLKILYPSIKDIGQKLEADEIQFPQDMTLLTTISPIPDIGHLIVMRDITELKRMEALKLEQERQEKEVIKTTFSRYMGPQLVNHLLQQGTDLSTFRERRNAVIMYADLRNSTAGMIKRVGPDTAVKLLNDFISHMTDIAMENQGIVFDFTGDEILVAFNALVDQPLASYQAISTAVAMQICFGKLQEKWSSQFGSDVGLGIGIDRGDVLIGNVGTESMMSFRMVGEVMSKAHRLVELANDGQIIMTAAVYDAFSPDLRKNLNQIQFNQLGPVSLKGFTSPQTIYKVQIR